MRGAAGCDPWRATRATLDAGLPEAPKLGAPARDVRRFIEQHQVQGQVVEVLPTTIQIRRAALDRLVRDGLFARRGDEGSHHPLQQVLVDPAVFVQAAEARPRSDAQAPGAGGATSPRSPCPEAGTRRQHGRLS